ncbi:type 1 glutamine amidotransferase family protein [Desulfoluna spongiiphila]|uniref:DJ-1/PfpI family protein n=1 Tax=Desulfoluna spongiiphila TaxID=419481 RepID=A0A1G5IP44_9BACT|nr:type 1 glutamine amidotransferase family protein [Desulfoluna spongiiphila]SCY77694.1 DJ-1/PfpI family protein [Desulfoluna spongiiphila]VVS92606.1 dj-1/pfpi [Desulfoluna spongiiphila]
MTGPKTIYLFLFDTLSDWEIGYVTTGLNNPMMQITPGAYQLKTFSTDGRPVRSAGGLQITPDLGMDEITLWDAEMLILPGGASWEEGAHQDVAELAKRFHENHLKVAAICGATYGLAHIGLLDSIRHTSNAKAYLEASNYKGGSQYVEALAVHDKNVITASGTAPLEFTREIFQALHLYKGDVLRAWYDLFKTSAPEAFPALMNALEA